MPEVSTARLSEAVTDRFHEAQGAELVDRIRESVKAEQSCGCGLATRMVVLFDDLGPVEVTVRIYPEAVQ